MASINDVTGDSIITKANNRAYRSRFNWAFCKDKNHTSELEYNECPSCGMITIVKNGVKSYTCKEE